MKWSWIDSLYCGYCYDEYFDKVENFFEKRFADAESDDCQYEDEYKTWLEVMETVMKMFNQNGYMAYNWKRKNFNIICF